MSPCRDHSTIDQAPMHLNADLGTNAFANTSAMTWALSPAPGVHRKPLERIGGEKVCRATSLVHYAPGARFAAHIHDSGEEFFVLDGVFSDDAGNYGRGSYVRNPPHSAHAPYSKNGCTILVKLGQIPNKDRRSVRVSTHDPKAPWQHNRPGTCMLPLYRSEAEQVSLVHWRTGLQCMPVRFEHGLEIYVLKGAFKDEYGHHGVGSWMRLAAGQSQTLQVLSDCEVLIKTGHLGPYVVGTLSP
ncbi:MAG: cupin [Robiginitomaculum sp.]|nr:MAG: cupin [Robiginitomaculum sp.]